MGTVREVVNKLNMLGINVVEVNSWAIVYEKNGLYGYVNTSVNNGMGEPCYSEILLFDWFLVALSVQFNVVRGHKRIKEQVKTVILTRGSSKNLLESNKSIRIQNNLEDQKEYKILHVQNLRALNVYGRGVVAANILINHRGKILRLKEYSLDPYIRLAGKTSTGLEVYDLMESSCSAYVIAEENRIVRLRLTENFDVLNNNIQLINGIYRV